MTQFEIYKSFQFVLELLVAELLYVYKLKRRPYFWLRLVVGLALLFTASYFFPVLSEDAFYCSFLFLMIFLMTMLLCFFLFRANWLTIFFCCIAGYTTQHIAYELYMVALNSMGTNVNVQTSFYGSSYVGMYSNPFLLAIYVLVYALVMLVCFFGFSERIDDSEDIELKAHFVFFFSIFIFVVDILLNAVAIYAFTDVPPSFLIVLEVYNVICCFVTLYLQFVVALENKTQSTLATVRRLYQSAKEQYASSKANIETINMRCHDLRHLISLIESGKAVDSPLLKDIKQRISIYESETKTGNTALDIILTEKGLLCNRLGVKLSCVADGQDLGFMREEDIYVLFGNILDNAIEAVEELAPEKRVIRLRIHTMNDFLIIEETNFYENSIRFHEGLPLTSKNDKSLHGYGMKSIRYLCEQYGGNFRVTTEDGVFSLSLMLVRQ